MPGWEEGWLTCSSPAKLSRRWSRPPSPSGVSTPPWPAIRSDAPGPSGASSFGADGRRVDLIRLAAHLHGLPLRLGDTASMPERSSEIAGLNYAVELRSWMAAPDPEQRRLRDIALDSLRDCGGGQPALVATAAEIRSTASRGTMADCGRRLCGFAFADRGHDLRLIQDYPGHRNPKHRVHYTRISGSRFESIWRY
jgi:hypothetical protein